MFRRETLVLGIAALAISAAGCTSGAPGEPGTTRRGPVEADEPVEAEKPVEADERVEADEPAEAVDEVDELAWKLDVPRRFAGYRPRWSVKKQEVVFRFMDGPQTWPFWFVMDGDRHVAIAPTVGFHNGWIYVQDFRPGQAPKELALPTERWHIDTSVGTVLRTDDFIPGEHGSTDASWDWRVEGERLVLVRRYRGKTKFNRWAHRTKTPVEVDATNTIVFRVDPRLGYVVDATYDTWTDPPPKTYEYTSAATSGRYLLWPGQATCYRHSITRAGEEGYVGYACNHGATKLHAKESCRERGFVSFLNDVTGWSPTTTLVKGGRAKLVVCGAHTDLDFVLTWPREPETGADGLKHNVVRHRVLALPPELTRHVWDAMKLLHEGERRLMIRFGVLEDFEAQPLELTTRERGMLWNAKVSEKHARSGRKSIVFSGKSGHGDPQIALAPDAAYLVEAWVKVIARTDATGAAGAEGEPAAYLSGWFYQWTPHGGKVLERFKSNVARAGAGDGWQRVAFEFRTPAWAPFIQLEFHGEGCTVYLDDFRFVRNDRGE